MLEIRAVSKTFNTHTPNELQALQAINLSVTDGSFVVIIGTNGSGKSTLLNAVAGSFRIDSGAIFLTGADITNWLEHKIGRASCRERVWRSVRAGDSEGKKPRQNI